MAAFVPNLHILSRQHLDHQRRPGISACQVNLWYRVENGRNPEAVLSPPYDRVSIMMDLDFKCRFPYEVKFWNEGRIFNHRLDIVIRR